MSPEQAEYIRARYQFLLKRGDLTKEQMKMFQNLNPSDKAEIDEKTLAELVSMDASFMTGRMGLDPLYLLKSDKDKAKVDYAYYRFQKLMDLEIIDWRDPQYMEKLNDYVNETGLDPRTGKPASDEVKFIAKHYGWTKGTSELVASIAGGVADYSDILYSPKSIKGPTHYTSPEVSSTVIQNGYTVDDFAKLVDADSVLSAKQTEKVRTVRLQVGLPQSSTKMTKIVPEAYFEGILSGKFNTVGGFISVDAHSSALTTLDEVYTGNRLDYANTPYHLNGDKTYGKINFSLDTNARLDIPITDPTAENGYPFTGRGFTGSSDIILPEFKIRQGAEYLYNTGDTITIYDSATGDVMQKYVYDKKLQHWLLD